MPFPRVCKQCSLCDFLFEYSSRHSIYKLPHWVRDSHQIHLFMSSVSHHQLSPVGVFLVQRPWPGCWSNSVGYAGSSLTGYKVVIPSRYPRFFLSHDSFSLFSSSPLLFRLEAWATQTDRWGGYCSPVFIQTFQTSLDVHPLNHWLAWYNKMRDIHPSLFVWRNGSVIWESLAHPRGLMNFTLISSDSIGRIASPECPSPTMYDVSTTIFLS